MNVVFCSSCGDELVYNNSGLCLNCYQNNEDNKISDLIECESDYYDGTMAI